MRRNSLEQKLSNYDLPFTDGSRKPNSNGATTRPEYKSKSEGIIGRVLHRSGIRFTYEDRVYVEESNGKDEKGRLWYPDFHLDDSGVIVEYVGIPEDENYMRGIKRKEEVYSQMGATVVWIYPEDIWTDDFRGKRPDAAQNILSKIYSAVARAGRDEELRDARVDTKAFNYNYRQMRYAA